MKEDRLEYGWYHKKLTIYLSLIGLVGLSFFILGILLGNFITYFLIPIGIIIMVVFLWPALGLITINLIVKNEDYETYQIVDKIQRIKEPKLLDIGCGTGRATISIAKRLKNGGRIYGIDIYDSSIISGNSLETVKHNAKIEKVEKKTEFLYGSALDIPFGDDEFHLVNSAFVLHEFHDKKKALNEIKRILKSNGIFCLTEFNRYSIQSILINGIFSVFFKSNNYWQKVLKDNGFKDIEFYKKGPFGRYFTKK